MINLKNELLKQADRRAENETMAILRLVAAIIMAVVLWMGADHA